MHIAFFGIPHAAHMNAAIPVLGALARRGYRVTCVTSDAFVARVESLGVEVVCCRGWRDTSAQAEPVFDEHPRIRVLNMNGICRMGLRIMSEVVPFYEKDRPDAIIYDFVNFAGRVLARRYGIPAVQISPHCAFDEGSIKTQVRDDDYREWVLVQGKKADRFFERAMMREGQFIYHREQLNVYTIPKVFQPDGAAIHDDRCFYAGRCVAEQAYYGDWRRTNGDDRPIALVSTSTTYVRDPGYFRSCIEALAGLHWHVVLSIGDNDPEKLRPLPPHFEIVQKTAHVKILPFAGLFILQGGNMSVAEAAFHGVPMIATSFGFAELEWCAETSIDRLGLGVHLRHEEIAPEQIRSAAVRIANDLEIQGNVKRISRIVKCEPGAEDVVNKIDDYLDGL